MDFNRNYYHNDNIEGNTDRASLCHWLYSSWEIMKRAAIITLSVGVVGAVLILLGGVLGWVAFPAIVESQVAQTVAIKNGTDAWDRWIELPLPMQFKVKIFNITNPEEITRGLEPKYEEVGPFVYTETRVKENIDYMPEHDRASYEQRSFFEFDANASAVSEFEYVMVPNIPLVAFAQITESIGYLASTIGSYNKSIPNIFPDQVGIFKNVTVHDYLFGGVKMNCSFGKDGLPDLQHINEIVLCAAYAQVAPKTVIIDPERGINTFSFFRYKNNTPDGRYEVGLGIKKVSEIGEVFLWENKTSTDKWGDESCNAIKGTDSTIFRPALEDVNELYIYNTDICRTVKLTYQKNTEYRGIAGRRYVTTEDVFASAINNPDNYCYCPQSVRNLTDRGACLRNGVLELSSCQGAPVVLSHPYFLFADDLYKSANQELSKNASEDLHQIYLDLEPYTGSPLRGASRIQMNIHLKQIPEIDIMKNFKGNLLPVLWMEEGVELNDDLLNMLHEELLDILDILNIVRWVLIGVGIAALCGATLYYVIKLR